VNAVARTRDIPQDRELLHAIPQEYTVDGQEGIREPVGMVGTRLETEMYLVTIGSAPATNLRRAVERAGYKVQELVLEPLASALAVLTEEEKELGVALIEMGAGSTDVAVFHEGKIRHLAAIMYGGNNVTNDIVHGLGLTQADAERVKERHGCAYEPMVDRSDMIALPSTAAQGDRQISRDLLAHIIHQRMDEIFDLVLRDIQGSGYLGKLASGIVLTGGASALPGMGELAADLFGTAVRVAIPHENIVGLSDAVEAPRFSTAVGLTQYGANRYAIGAGTPASKKAPMLNAPGMEKLARGEAVAAGLLLAQRARGKGSTGLRHDCRLGCRLPAVPSQFRPASFHVITLACKLFCGAFTKVPSQHGLCEERAYIVWPSCSGGRHGVTAGRAERDRGAAGVSCRPARLVLLAVESRA
jgi:cell division protein FtsA